MPFDTGSKILDAALERVLGARGLSKSSSCCCAEGDLVGDLCIAIATVKGQMKDQYVGGTFARIPGGIDIDNSLSRVLDLLGQIRGVVPYKILLGLERVEAKDRDMVRERCKQILEAWLRIEVVSEKIQEFSKDNPTIQTFSQRAKNAGNFDDLSKLLSHLAMFYDWNESRLKWNRINHALENDFGVIDPFLRGMEQSTVGTVKALEIVSQVSAELRAVQTKQDTDGIWFNDEIFQLVQQKGNITFLDGCITAYRNAVAGKYSSEELGNIWRNAQALSEFLKQHKLNLWTPYLGFTQKLRRAMPDSLCPILSDEEINKGVQELEKLLKLQIRALEYLKDKAPVELVAPLKSKHDKLVEFVREINQALVSKAISLGMEPEGSEEKKEKTPVEAASNPAVVAGSSDAKPNAAAEPVPVTSEEVKLVVSNGTVASSAVPENVVVAQVPEVVVAEKAALPTAIDAVVFAPVVAAPAAEIPAEKQPQVEEKKSEPEKEPTVEEQLAEVKREIDVLQSATVNVISNLASVLCTKKPVGSIEEELVQARRQLKALQMHMKSAEEAQVMAGKMSGSKFIARSNGEQLNPVGSALPTVKDGLRHVTPGLSPARAVGAFSEIGSISVRERIANLEKLNGSASGSPTANQKL